MSTTVICEVCFGYGWTEEPKNGRGHFARKREKGGWWCGWCDGLGNVGTPPERIAPKGTPNAIGQRERRRRHRAAGRKVK